MILMEIKEQNGHLNEDNTLLKIDIKLAEWETYNNYQRNLWVNSNIFLGNLICLKITLSYKENQKRFLIF